MYQQIVRLRQSWRIASAPTAARRARRLPGWRLKRDCEIDLMPCASALLELSLCACARAAPTNSIKRCYGHPWPKFRPVTISGVFRPNLGEVPLFFRQGNGSTTPRGGAVTLSDVREPALVIVCESCERRGRYKVERLMAEHEDAMLTDLLNTGRLPQGALDERPRPAGAGRTPLAPPNPKTAAPEKAPKSVCDKRPPDSPLENSMPAASRAAHPRVALTSLLCSAKRARRNAW
jgi:hypothetical protein